MDQNRHLRNELNETLRNKNHAVILTKLGAFTNDVCDLSGDLRQSHMFGLNFLAYEHAIDLSA